MAAQSKDPYIKRQIGLERVAITESKTAVAATRKVYADIRTVLVAQGTHITSKKQLNKVNKQITDIMNKEYGKTVRETQVFMGQLMREEIVAHNKLLDNATVKAYKPSKPSLKKVETMVMNTPLILNNKVVTVDTMLNNWPVTERRNVINQTTTGFYRGETTTVMTRNVRQQLEQAPRHYESITRTLVNHIDSVVDVATGEENEDAVRGYVLVAVLDSGTTEFCRGIDDTRVGFNDDYQPLPPFHVNCRTITRPWLREDLAAISEGTRTAEGDTPQAIDENYYQWLKRQGEKDIGFVEEVLGKGQADIFMNSGITPEEFRRLTMKNATKPMTLAELEDWT